MIEIFVKIVNDVKSVFAKLFIIDVCQGIKYVPAFITFAMIVNIMINFSFSIVKIKQK